MDYNKELKDVTDQAIQKGDANADYKWKMFALECVEILCLSEKHFSVNDVRRLLNTRKDIYTHNKRAIGGIMRKAKNLGWIKAVGYYERSEVSHGAPVVKWESRLFIEEQKSLFL